MKVLFIGDASNLHSTLAKELNRMGHYAIVASNGSGWMNTHRDINLSRKKSKLGAIGYLCQILAALPRMRGFDIVQFSNPIFWSLRPEKLRHLFGYLKQHNRKVCLSALGTDYDYVQKCYDGKTFRYSDYKIGNEDSPYLLSSESEGQENWQLPLMRDYHRYFIDNIDGVIACLYEYYITYKDIIPAGKLAYGGIPIDIQQLEQSRLAKKEAPADAVRFFIGIQKDRNVLKGTDLLLAALKRLKCKYPDLCDISVAENVPYDDYITRMGNSHVILDQLYSYTPATNALLAMAQGLVAVSGAEPEFYEFINENSCKPIINVSPLIDGDIDNKLEWIIANKDRLPLLSQQSIDFVHRHNDCHIVAQRHLDFWNKILQQ